MVVLVFKIILSKLYFCLWWFWSRLYFFNILTSKKVSKTKIVSVGNLTVGGSGKTPFVCLLSNLLSENKKKHVVVSRGYKKEGVGEVVVSDGSQILSSLESSGDEGYMLASNLKNIPVVVGNKLKAIQKAFYSFGDNVFIVDDGYQTLSLKRDLNILLIDFSLDINQYKMMPLGLLREPLSQIYRSDLVVFTKSNLVDKKTVENLKDFFSRFIKKKQKVLCADFVSSLVVEKTTNSFIPVYEKFLIDKRVVSFCGLGNPSSFCKMVEKYSKKNVKFFCFPDHYKYTKTNFKKVVDFAISNNVDSLITTQKDYVKIKDFDIGLKIYIINVKHKLQDVGVLLKTLKQKNIL